jgi:ribosomal protein S27AE
MITGARQGTLSGLRRLVAAAMARDLCVFIIPGSDITRAHGLDVEAAGMRPVTSPRHASVLLVVGPLSLALRDAAAIIYAQMVRPRALLALGTNELSPLPPADVAADLSQQALIAAVRRLRTVFTESAYRPQIADFDAPMLHIRIEYTCPMHPEVIQNEPGSCPKCGMTLMPHEAQASTEQVHTDQPTIDKDATKQTLTPYKPDRGSDMNHDTPVEYTCPMHPEVVQNEPGFCPQCGMFLVHREVSADSGHEHQPMTQTAPVEYTCPMHPEVVQNEPGSCPQCGMFLVPR